MRYHYERPDMYFCKYGEVYECDHPVYSSCTLYRVRDLGLAVIQQRYDPETKSTRWGPIDPWLTDEIYLTHGFKSLFLERGGAPRDGVFPTCTVRQLMWALRLRPMRRERWETCFDRRDI